MLAMLARNSEDAVTIAAAGAIPLLVQLLKPGSPVNVQETVTGALGRLAAFSEIRTQSPSLLPMPTAGAAADAWNPG
jgi:hypothetical protein